jgi:phage tail sheath protein FI
MPEYLAPGVYVEETSFRAKSIEGVGTSTTAFVGPTRKGPFSQGETAPARPELLTSFGDFERLYGGLADLEFNGAATTNYLAHAVLAYFNEGGSRLYVSRVVPAGASQATVAVTADGTAPAETVSFTARFPGTGGNGVILLRDVGAPASVVTMDSAPQGSLLQQDGGVFHIKIGDQWRPVGTLDDPDSNVAASTLTGDNPQLITLSLVVTDADGVEGGWEGLGLHPAHPAYVGTVLAANPPDRVDQLNNLVSIAIGADVTPDGLLTALRAAGTASSDGLRRLQLSGGGDGSAAPASGNYTNALAEVADLEDVSIVAAPGSSDYGDANNQRAVMNALISHAEARRAYRIAVLDTPRNQIPGDVRTLRGQLDSRYAAMYYPWVVVPNPNARPGRSDIPREIALPPSGHVCGIYARNDVQRGVHKAPANEVVRGALRFEFDVNVGHQELLNPLGVNCLRLLSGRGYRVWGARLISSDPEWKYVSDRRYFNYLESSIDRGTQWAVFEPNGERLWANVRQTISDFLYNEWRNGALLGTTPDEAFFVRCDRSTMTQNDLDNGRLICLIGVAIIKPAEFVIFRIGQKTADARA